jgi:hypothetical protein
MPDAMDTDTQSPPLAPPLTPAEIEVLLTTIKRSRTALLILAPLCALLAGWAIFSGFEHSASIERLHDALAQNHARETTELLRLAAEPISSVIVKEMAEGSVYGIERYFRRWKAIPGIVQLTLVRNDGKILASTDNGHQGMEFNRTFRDGILGSKYVAIDRDDAGVIRVVIPIVDRDLIKGVVLLVYQNPRSTNVLN